MPIPADQLTAAHTLLFAYEDQVPPEVRDMVKFAHRVEGNSIVLFEHRVTFSRPGEWHEEPSAKFTYVAKTGRWRLLWMGRSLKWQSYPELPEAATFQELFAEVDADPCGCFKG